MTRWDNSSANIVHHVLPRVFDNGSPSIEGAVMLHPWFGGNRLTRSGFTRARTQLAVSTT
jgi:hypothetical protein